MQFIRKISDRTCHVSWKHYGYTRTRHKSGKVSWRIHYDRGITIEVGEFRKTNKGIHTAAFLEDRYQEMRARLTGVKTDRRRRAAFEQRARNKIEP